MLYFDFYIGLWEVLKTLSDKNYVILANAIFDYGFNGKEPELAGDNKKLFKALKPFIGRRFDEEAE